MSPSNYEDAIFSPKTMLLSEVEPEEVDWLWQGKIPIGKITLIAGDPGLGKSFITLDLAARVTTGAPWPGGAATGRRVGSVLLLSAEDGMADTILPRLDAAGGDPKLVRVVTEVQANSADGSETISRPFRLDWDVDSLGPRLEMIPDACLVVIDPISAYLGGVDAHRNSEVRAVLAKLAKIAEQRQVAIVMVDHLNKNAKGPAAYRTMGSIAFSAAARATWIVTKDKNDPDRRLFLPLKNNLAVDSMGFAYRLAPKDDTAVVEWEPDPVSTTADEALGEGAASRRPSPKRDGAEVWLRANLADGPRGAKEVTVEAMAADITTKTLQAAFKELGCIRMKDGMKGGWFWSLPKDTLVTDEMGIFGDESEIEPLDSGVTEDATLKEQKGIFEETHQRKPDISFEGERLPCPVVLEEQTIPDPKAVIEDSHQEHEDAYQDVMGTFKENPVIDEDAHQGMGGFESDSTLRDDLDEPGEDDRESDSDELPC